MKWSWKLGRFAGIDAYVHASFLLLVAWAAWAAWAGAGTGLAVVMGVAFLLAVFASVLLHELGHALTARRYGIRTRRIILSPIGGIAQLEGMPRRPQHELWVALAGPAVNFVLAAALWLVMPVFGGASLVGQLVGSVMVANVGLGLFNLVPAFPMDGGRVLRALLAGRVGSRRATEVAASVGKAIAVVMGVVGLLWGPLMLTMVAAFVWLSGRAELQAARAGAYDGMASSFGRSPSGDRRGRAWPWGDGGSRRTHAAYDVEVLDTRARAGGRTWAELLFDERVGRTAPPRTRPMGTVTSPVRVILVRRGWFG